MLGLVSTFNAYAFFFTQKRDEKKWKANLIKVADIYGIINISNVSVGTGENILGKLQL